MKNAKAPTRAQKILISGYRLAWQNWLVCSETRAQLVIIHRHTGTTKTLLKEGYN